MTDKRKLICAAPWTHLSFEPNGAVFTCCMATSYQPLGMMDKDREQDLDDIWNSALMKEIRLSMLEGDWPQQCQPCWDLEKNGSLSQRLFINERFKDQFDNLVQETNDKGRVNFEPQYLGLRFSNICNFACRICDGQLSTSWYKDEEKLGREHPQGPLKLFKNLDHLEKFFSPLWDSLSWVYFAGGEPFLSVEHHSFLHLLRRHQRLDVQLLYNTNFSTLSVMGDDLFDLWDGFKSVTLNVSLDAIQERGEYLRYGQEWAETENLLKRALSSDRPIKIIYTPVISAHNIHHLPDYLIYLMDNFKATPEEFVLDPLKSPDFFSIQVLPEAFKKVIKDRLIVAQKEVLQRFDVALCGNLLKQITGLIKLLEEDDQYERNWSRFIKEVKDVDELRKQSFLKTFPEFSPYFKA